LLGSCRECLPSFSLSFFILISYPLACPHHLDLGKFQVLKKCKAMDSKLISWGHTAKKKTPTTTPSPSRCAARRVRVLHRTVRCKRLSTGARCDNRPPTSLSACSSSPTTRNQKREERQREYVQIAFGPSRKRDVHTPGAGWEEEEIEAMGERGGRGKESSQVRYCMQCGGRYIIADHSTLTFNHPFPSLISNRSSFSRLSLYVPDKVLILISS